MKLKINKTWTWVVFALSCLFLVSTAICGLAMLKFRKENGTVDKYESTKYDISVTLTNDETYNKDTWHAFVGDSVKEIEVKIDYSTNYEQVKDYIVNVDLLTYVKPSNQNYGVYGEIKHLLTNQKGTPAIKETFTIDYQTYVNDLKEYIAANDLDSKTVGKLELAFYLTKGEEIVKKGNVEISLLENAVNVYETFATNNQTIINTKSKAMLMLLGAMVCFLISLVGFVCFGFFVKLVKMDEYERELYFIFKFNSAILTQADLASVDLANLVMVNSFKELAKVQNNLSLPIIYKKDSNEVRFVIKTNSGGYGYFVKRKGK